MPLLKGISFPLKFNKRGSLSVTEGMDKIKENIKAIIITGVGERVMNPSVGALGYKELFRNMDAAEVALLKYQLRLGIEAGEGRVTILDIEVSQPQREGQLAVDLTFKIDTSNEFENSVIYL